MGLLRRLWRRLEFGEDWPYFAIMLILVGLMAFLLAGLVGYLYDLAR